MGNPSDTGNQGWGWGSERRAENAARAREIQREWNRLNPQYSTAKSTRSNSGGTPRQGNRSSAGLFGDPDAEAAKRRAKGKERMSAWEAKWKAKKHAKVVAEGDAIRAAYKAKKSAKKKLPGVLGVALFGALAHKDLMEKATGGVKEKVKSKIKENTKYIYSDQGGSAATRSGSFN